MASSKWSVEELKKVVKLVLCIYLMFLDGHRYFSGLMNSLKMKKKSIVCPVCCGFFLFSFLNAFSFLPSFSL